MVFDQKSYCTSNSNLLYRNRNHRKRQGSSHGNGVSSNVGSPLSTGIGPTPPSNAVGGISMRRRPRSRLTRQGR